MSKEKIIDFLDRQIKDLKEIISKKEDMFEFDNDFDLWDKTTRRFLRKIFGSDVSQEYLDCLNYEPSRLEMGYSQFGWNAYQLAKPGNIKLEMEEVKFKFLIKTSKIINLLEALKREVEFFDDKDMEKYVKRLKRFWKLKPGLLTKPFIDAEVGMEEEISK